MNHEPRTFPCMDDSPENNGWGYNNDLWENRPQVEEEDIEFPREKENAVTIIFEANQIMAKEFKSISVINTGSFACVNSNNDGDGE